MLGTLLVYLVPYGVLEARVLLHVLIHALMITARPTVGP